MPRQWTLPLVVDPPRICLQIEIPDDIYHKAAFLGSLAQLGYQASWQRDDPLWTALPVSIIWYQIFLKAAADLDLGGNCSDCPTIISGLLEDFELPLRVDCDCNVFVTCCDGTEKQILTSDQVKQLMQQQPGTGAPQPPAGGCVDYQGTLQAGGRFLLPTTVSAGDTITVKSASGLTNDGSEAEWRDYRGSWIFAGIDLGAQKLEATDIDPMIFHDAMLIKLGLAYYAGYGAFTVPVGVTNEQPVLLLNTTAPASMAGSIDLKVEVCNNQTATWTHVFDFTVNSQGWTLSPVPPGYSGAAGNYVPGVGWQDNLASDPSSNAFRLLQIVSPIVTATPITGMSLQLSGSDGDLSTAPFGDGLYSYNGTTLTVHRSDPASPFPTSPYATSIASVPMTQVGFDILVGYHNSPTDPGGNVTVARLTVTGTGSDPF